MKIFQIIFIIIVLSLINCNTKKTTEITYYSKSFYDTYFFIFQDFKNNENSLKKIFKVADSCSIDLSILKDINAIKIVGTDSTNIDIDYFKSIVFNFSKQQKKYNWIKIFDNNKTFFEKKSILFTVKKENKQTHLTADFIYLSINTLQNFLDYAEKDEIKKETEDYTYILFNKDKQEKMKLIYHDKGAWFEVEIL
ncbi:MULTISPECIES: hypothetical protein [unclassified Apibacter]|uniref:hypothetical protein n=1 Tax=unclassified Apibacter TaxID=2630820 RepID=UPI001321165C|nr:MULTISPECIES: hypothetical protein [unclassified Apibacter]MCX8677533.1 hypothetical protein [Apibacter sp. B3919]MXO24263.1 hypothetical protein [Apibacter sp. B3924]MXO27052.1 hypothetical protein [Apibacter sp. B3813]MXO28821.1 hypothetical protein [Apibacter sp. B3913]MXO30772.1 hypothetical protein [Apibacter sp. B3912]